MSFASYDYYERCYGRPWMMREVHSMMDKAGSLSLIKYLGTKKHLSTVVVVVAWIVQTSLSRKRKKK